VVHATFVFIEPLFLSLDARPLSHSHCNRLSCPIIFSTTEEKTPAMEKNKMPIVDASNVAAGASAAAPVQAPVAAYNVAAGASAAGASAAAPVQAPVAASDVATGASAAGASAAAPVQAPVDWDPYEPVSYVAPEKPYDTSIVDDEPEVTLCSLVLIPFQSFCVRSCIIRVRLFLVQSFCVRSYVIRVCLFLVLSFCVRSCVIRVRLFLV
jgi:nucleoid-associated protein YgaU